MGRQSTVLWMLAGLSLPVRAEEPAAYAWFDNAGGFRPSHDLAVLRRGIEEGMLDRQDEWGMTALDLAVASGWQEGVDALLRAGADTELRYFRTGETTLYIAVQQKKAPIIAALVAAGANPDAPNYWGVTPRKWATEYGAKWFDAVPVRPMPLPPPRIQNAEHLADHYERFEIPSREERATLKVGQAVDLFVYGPKSAAKQDRVKARITKVEGRRPGVRFTGTVETPIERTHLSPGTTVLEFGPEHVATVYVPRP
jgi:Ankyrin repeat